MENISNNTQIVYRKTKTVLSYIRFNIIFATRYRRTIFLEKEVAKRGKELIRQKCKELGIKVKSLHIEKNYVNMIIESPPDLSPNHLVHRIKQYCNVSEFTDMEKTIGSIPNFWTREYLISTELLDEETIESYISSKLTRPKKKTVKKVKIRAKDLE